VIRPAIVTASAVIEFLGSAFFLLFAVVLVFAGLTSMGEHANIAPIAFGAAVFLLVFVALGVATGVGLIRLKQWARISTLIFAGIMAAMGLLSMSVLALMPTQPPPGLTVGAANTIRWLIVGSYGIPVAIGVWWLILFNRTAIKEAFAAGVVTPRTSTRPMSISIIGWWLLVSGPFTVILAIIGLPAFFAGAVLEGWAGRAVYLLMGAIVSYIGWELLQLRERGRLLAIGWLALGILNSAYAVLVPGVRERMRELQVTMQSAPPPQAPFDSTSFSIVILAFTVGLMGVGIWLLVRHKPAFQASS